jgi:short-subunit dehydrogenase
VSDLTNKVVAITGAGHGLGAALAEVFEREGARLALCDLDAAALEKWSKSPNLLLSHVDVGDPEEVEAWAEAVKAHFGACDILINNAGITHMATFEQHTLKDWERVFRVNLWGVIHCTHSFLPLLKASKGQIVNISSLFGIIAIPAQPAYIASKFAIRGLSEALWEELQEDEISVTVVHPGGLSTKIIEHSTSSSRAFSKHTQDFFSRFALSPHKAASLILSAVKKRKPRLLIGKEAYLFDRVKRLFPVAGNRWAFKEIYKAMRLNQVTAQLKKGE